MQDLGNTLWQLLQVAGTLIVDILLLALSWSLVLFWLAWALWGLNWRKLFPTLAQGAWAPVVLLALVTALTWAFIDPTPLTLAGVTIAPYWGHVVAVTLLLAATAFCGWLQLLLGWHPPEIELEPAPAAGHDHDGHHEPGTTPVHRTEPAGHH